MDFIACRRSSSLDAFPSSAGYSHYESPFERDPPEDADKLKKFKSTNWCFILYPDSVSFPMIVQRIKLAECVFVCSPLHAPDEAEVYKPHFHVLCVFGNDRHFNAVWKLFGIDSHLLKVCSDPLAYIRYLVHLGYDKPQYDRSLIRTNAPSLVNRAFSLQKSVDPVLGIQQINDALMHIDFSSEWELEMWCYEHNLERIYHHVRQSIHNSWDHIQRMRLNRFVNSSAHESSGQDAGYWTQGDIDDWEDLINNGG